jgi:hypothetical protein
MKKTQPSLASQAVLKSTSPHPLPSHYLHWKNQKYPCLSESLDTELMSTPAGTDKRNASQLSPNSPTSIALPKKIKELKKTSGIPVGFGTMSGPK